MKQDTNDHRGFDPMPSHPVCADPRF